MMYRSNRLLFTALAAMAVVPIAGCWSPGYRPGGQQATRGVHTFESTQDFLQSIQIVDLATNDVIWSIHVPLGEQVVLRFYDQHDPENVERPALMRWELMPRGTRWGELDNAIPVPAYDRRLMNVFYRDRDMAPGLELGQSR